MSVRVCGEGVGWQWPATGSGALSAALRAWDLFQAVTIIFITSTIVWSLDFPGGSDGKASAYNAGDPGSISRPGRSPGEGNGNPLQYGKSHGWKSLVGYRPWGGKELDRTEQLHFHFHALEKEMATHSSMLAWRIPGTGAWWATVYGVTQSRTRLM